MAKIESAVAIHTKGLALALELRTKASIFADGADPRAGLIRDTAGNFYGTTYVGGASTACTGGCGVVFKLHP